MFCNTDKVILGKNCFLRRDETYSDFDPIARYIYHILAQQGKKKYSFVSDFLLF